MWHNFWVLLVSLQVERDDKFQWQTVSPAATAAATTSPSPKNRPILPRLSGFAFGFGSGNTSLGITVASEKTINTVCVSYLLTQTYIMVADSLSLYVCCNSLDMYPLFHTTWWYGLTSNVEWELCDLPARFSGHPTEVQARVFSPDPGHMKSDLSWSESVFVALHPSCELLALRLINRVVQMIKHLQLRHYEYTVDLQWGDGYVGFGWEAPIHCDVVVLLCLIDWTCVKRLNQSLEEKKSKEIKMCLVKCRQRLNSH